jgi:hypothetical protein
MIGTESPFEKQVLFRLVDADYQVQNGRNHSNLRDLKGKLKRFSGLFMNEINKA